MTVEQHTPPMRDSSGRRIGTLKSTIASGLRSSTERSRERLHDYRGRVEGLTPDELTVDGGWRSGVFSVRGIILLSLLDLNAWSIRRSTGGGTPAWWETGGLDWAADLESAWPAIRVELEEYIHAHELPSTASVNGLSRSEEGRGGAIPDGHGIWRILLLKSFGKTVEANAKHFPATMQALRRVPATANIGFSALDPGARIEAHCDPNAGALRYQLPILVPGEPGTCRITVDGEEVAWAEGRSVLFDLSREHFTCNEGDGPRVLLMFEVPMPLPFPASTLNRVTQWSYRMLPSYRGIRRRAAELAASPAGTA